MRAQTLRQAELERIARRPIRQRGYALQDSLFGNGLRVLAVPVLDTDGYPVAAISLAAPVMRMSMDEVPRPMRSLPAAQRSAQISPAPCRRAASISTAV